MSRLPVSAAAGVSAYHLILAASSLMSVTSNSLPSFSKVNKALLPAGDRTMIERIAADDGSVVYAGVVPNSKVRAA